LGVVFFDAFSAIFLNSLLERKENLKFRSGKWIDRRKMHQSRKKKFHDHVFQSLERPLFPRFFAPQNGILFAPGPFFDPFLVPFLVTKSMFNSTRRVNSQICCAGWFSAAGFYYFRKKNRKENDLHAHTREQTAITGGQRREGALFCTQSWDLLGIHASKKENRPIPLRRLDRTPKNTPKPQKEVARLLVSIWGLASFYPGNGPKMGPCTKAKMHTFCANFLS
jgi:hypothetical protein